MNRETEYYNEIKRLKSLPFESISAKEHASIVRKELKKTFPEIKFKVTSHHFAGGNAVRVSTYEKLPQHISREEVCEFVNRFDGYMGGFMDDGYNVGFEYDGKRYRGANFCSFS